MTYGSRPRGRCLLARECAGDRADARPCGAWRRGATRPAGSQSPSSSRGRSVEAWPTSCPEAASCRHSGGRTGAAFAPASQQRRSRCEDSVRDCGHVRVDPGGPRAIRKHPQLVGDAIEPVGDDERFELCTRELEVESTAILAEIIATAALPRPRQVRADAARDEEGYCESRRRERLPSSASEFRGAPRKPHRVNVRSCRSNAVGPTESWCSQPSETA
jgi:hypothetical protein